MAQPVRDSFLDLEKHRQLLEENIAKLRKSLEHWQLWEAEYEGLKEEIEAVKPEPTFQQLITIGREYGGTLLRQDEVDDVLGVKSGKLRSASQVTDLLSKRMDYVQQNVRTLEKQLHTLENKLVAATVISAPDNMNEDGLPMTEIFEELDDDGNIISSRLSTPGSSKAQLLEVLEKAGVKDLKDGSPVASGEDSKNERPAPSKENPKDETTLPVKEISKQVSTEPTVQEATEIHATVPRKPLKRSVTFAEDIKINTFKKDSRPNMRGGAILSPTKDMPPAEEQIAAMLDGQNDKIFHNKDQSYSPEEVKAMTDLVKEHSKPLPSDAVVPENELEADAALRQEMLKYGMSELGEVGAIVAELTLEENDSSFTDDDEYEDEDEEGEDVEQEDDSSVEDDEDAYGRSTGKIVTDKMHRQMRELEERLNARMMENVGPDGEKNKAHGGIGQIKITEIAEEPSIEKKGVRFADKLDIQSDPKESKDPKPSSKPAAPAKSPIGDIVERAPAPTTESKAPAPTKKVSKFKSTRAAQPPTETPIIHQPIKETPKRPNPVNPSNQPPSFPLKPVKTPSPFSAPIPINSMEITPQTRTRTVPTGPQKSIIADIIEHDPSETSTNATEPDAFDPDLLNQEVATEFHKMRTRMIMRDGGFLRDEEEMEVDEDGFVRIPVDEDDGGKRVSRFMAARVARG